MSVKTFVLKAGTEKYQGIIGDGEHTFSCATLDEALRNVMNSSVMGVPSRIVATREWEDAYGPLAAAARKEGAPQ